jgi:hypothetical protein
MRYVMDHVSAPPPARPTVRSRVHA